jgi:DNA-binding Lrp family transcriptional regulator
MEDDSKLTLKDKRILKELDLDARQSNSKIAKKTRLSKNIVNYRIKRLQEIGIIKGFNTIFDYSKLGYFLVRVYIDLYEHDSEKEKELIDFLVKENSTGRVSATVGNWDLIVSFYVKEIVDFRTFWFEFLEKYRPIIKEYNTNIVTENILFRRAYLLGETKDTLLQKWSRGAARVEKVDGVDEKIIHLLTENARTPIETIAYKTKLGSMAIIYRIKQLIKKEIIVGYKINIDLGNLGYDYYKVTLELEDTKIVKNLITYCHQHPNIISVTESISDNVDFEFNMELKDFNTFLKIIDDLKKEFKKKLRNYKYVRILRNYKNVYLPS